MGTYSSLIAQDTRFSLNDALWNAQTEFGDDFVEHWGFNLSEPPEGIPEQDWRELRRIHQLAKQLSAIGATLIKKKGIGPGTLAEVSRLTAEATEFESKIDNALEAIKAKYGPEVWVKAYMALLPQSAGDPRTRSSVFESTLELETSRLFLPSLSATSARLKKLLAYAVAGHGERVNAYLSRVALCYCLDQRTELAVMCRAVVEAAMERMLRTTPSEQG